MLVRCRDVNETFALRLFQNLRKGWPGLANRKARTGDCRAIRFAPDAALHAIRGFETASCQGDGTGSPQFCSVLAVAAVLEEEVAKPGKVVGVDQVDT